MVATRERPQSIPGTGASADKPVGTPNRGSVTGGRERFGSSEKTGRKPAPKK